MAYQIKSKIWIESNGKILLGEGRVQLLKAIKETGSLSKAAQKLKMSYKKAWGLIDAVNSIAEKEVVIKNIGGKSGGGTVLTEYGDSLIDTFEKTKMFFVKSKLIEEWIKQFCKGNKNFIPKMNPWDFNRFEGKDSPFPSVENNNTASSDRRSVID